MVSLKVAWDTLWQVVQTSVPRYVATCADASSAARSDPQKKTKERKKDNKKELLNFEKAILFPLFALIRYTTGHSRRAEFT
jgi:hypothetical protein